MRLPAFFNRTPGDVDTLVWTDGDDRPAADALRKYAAESLSPDDETLARMGASVRAAFVESQMSHRAGRTAEAGAAGGSTASGHFLANRRRRAFASMCAVAILTLSSVGFAGAQSNPGQPFYRLRLNLEGVHLPFAAPGDQLAGNLASADARLAEVGREATVLDWNAAADAADAYREVILATTIPSDPAARAAALQHLDEQLVRLEQLRGTSKGAETAALDRAIAALCKLLGIPVPTPTPAPTSVTRPRVNGGATPTESHKPRDEHGSGPVPTEHATPTWFDPDSGRTEGTRPRH